MKKSRFRPSPSSPKADKKITSRGLPRVVETVPGARWSPGTPDWLAKVARAAEGKAK